jgi:hypothetical protein
MAERPAKKTPPPQPASKPVGEVPDDEVFDDDPTAVNVPEIKPVARTGRDWRDIERLREERELKRLMGDDVQDLLDELTSHRYRPKPG